MRFNDFGRHRDRTNTALIGDPARSGRPLSGVRSDTPTPHPDVPMRLPLLAFTLLAALTASGCDSSGIDTNVPTPPGSGGSGGSGGGTGGGGTGGGGTGTTPTRTFAPVDPTATYLLTDEETPDAVAYLLADFGLAPGDTACFRAQGDFYYHPGVLASETGTPLATGAFSASNELNATADPHRIKDALDGDWFVTTNPMYTSGAATDVDEDFDATDACWAVPAGATHLFLSAYDDMFLDNTDALVDGQPFGVAVTEQ